VHNTFTVTNLIPFVGGSDDDMDPPDLRTNPSQQGGDNDIGLANGTITRSMLRRL